MAGRGINGTAGCSRLGSCVRNLVREAEHPVCYLLPIVPIEFRCQLPAFAVMVFDLLFISNPVGAHISNPLGAHICKIVGLRFVLVGRGMLTVLWWSRFGCHPVAP